MKEQIKIEVTAEDISAGIPLQPGCCPIALACKRAGIEDPRVGTRRILGAAGFYEMPPEATRFVDVFDWNGSSFVKPFSFVAVRE